MIEWILFGIIAIIPIVYFCYLISYPKWKIWKLIEKEIEKRRKS